MLNNLIGKVENTENSINDILNYKTIRNSYATANTLADGSVSTVNSYNFKHFKDSKDLYDQPGYFIFKLVFYFDDANGSEGLSGFEGGLLGGVSQKSEDEANDISSLEETTGNNSALYFLLANGEYERAEYLNTFLELLSDINVKSPWYFQTLTGLSEGLQQHKDGKWKIDEYNGLPPYKLEIGLLSDSLDTRIGTMLDAYKTACFSAQQKKEIIPANLRKFNMGVYIGSVPIRNINSDRTLGGTINNIVGDKTASYKYYELRGCEIDPVESYVLENIANDKPFEMKHKLVIRYSNIYEESYNQFMGKFITDNVIGDMTHKTPMTKETAEKIVNQAKFVMEDNSGGFFTNAAKQLTTFAATKLNTALNRLILGNIYTISGKRLLEQAADIANGNVLGGVRSVSNYVRTAKSINFSPNIYSKSGKGIGEINPSITPNGSRNIGHAEGNIYDGANAINNEEQQFKFGNIYNKQNDTLNRSLFNNL